jgi:hypothetical protein
MCSGSEAGSHLRIIDFVHHSTRSLRVIKKKRRADLLGEALNLVVGVVLLDHLPFRVQG